MRGKETKRKEHGDGKKRREKTRRKKTEQRKRRRNDEDVKREKWRKTASFSRSNDFLSFPSDIQAISVALAKEETLESSRVDFLSSSEFLASWRSGEGCCS